MGCGEQLILGEGRQLWCCHSKCPRPTAAAEILADTETGHVIAITPERFNVRHPLRERLGDALLACGLHMLLESEDGPELAPGRYRGTVCSDGRWDFTPLGDA
jgi:Family of unknown function (DUF6085)